MLSDTFASDIHARVEAAQMAAADRDKEMMTVRRVRRGRMHELYPELFSDESSKSIVGNTIDVAARDTAELMAPLPALACASGNMRTHADEVRASNKNKVGSYYWRCSDLATQNINFADAVNCYSFGMYVVEANFAASRPHIRWESSFGTYYQKNLWGEVVWAAKVKDITIGQLIAMYPDLRSVVMVSKDGKAKRNESDPVQLVQYWDKDRCVVYLPEHRCQRVASYSNPLSRVPVVIAERPDQEGTPRGQYDDVVPIEMARATMGLYMMKAADQSVNAPIAVPDDVTELSLGADAVLRANNPQQIQRVRLDVPQDVFAFSATLDQSSKEGARYPEARTGGIKGNIVTGRGVQELMGTMDTQVQTMQTIIGRALEQVTSLCFEMDAALWPAMAKKITGVLTGKPFELSYTPAKDIGDSWECKVTYGFAAGLSPSQAIVALLQLRGDAVISRDTLRRQLPFDIDAEEEQRSVDVQDIEDAAKQGLMALVQAMGPMVAQGQNVAPILLATAKVAEMRAKGSSVHEALLAAFKPPEPPPGQEQAPPAGPEAPPGPPGPEGPGAPPGPAGADGGMRDNGLQQGTAYGQQGMGPGGMPAVSALMAELRGNGDARMSAGTMRKRPIGAG